MERSQGHDRIDDELVEGLVAAADARAWLHDDPEAYRAGVAALRRELDRARVVARPRDEQLADRAV